MSAARDRLTRTLDLARRVAGIHVEPWRWGGQQLAGSVREVRSDLEDLAEQLRGIELDAGDEEGGRR